MNAYLLLPIQFLQNYLLPTGALLHKLFFYYRRITFLAIVMFITQSTRASGKHDAAGTREPGDKPSCLYKDHQDF